MTTIASHLLFDTEEAVKTPNVFVRLFAAWQARRRARVTLYELSTLDTHLLRDIGIEPDDVHDALAGKHASVLLNPMRPIVRE